MLNPKDNSQNIRKAKIAVNINAQRTALKKFFRT
jgi:hypothetical protein